MLYNIGIRLYRVGVSLAAAMGNAKARLWLSGRSGWRQQMRLGKGDYIWVHAASLGEFEQGRPVLEAIRNEYPAYKILLTFFSPSGYEVRKTYPGADHIFYLPLDTKQNARDFVQLVSPKLAIFIKYEFWYHFLTTLYKENIPVLLISGIFRPGQVFFKPHGKMFRRLLEQLRWIFVQNKESLELLGSIGIQNASLAGDTRFDRVSDLLKDPMEVAGIADFISGRKVVVAGSTWPEDEQLLAAWWRPSADRCLIIAPHEIHVSRLQALFPEAVLYSSGILTGSVMIIDNVGMLSALYRYATVTYVGGGFGKDGIHNILEPATYSKPVVFGPVFDKFPEASGLLAAGGGASVNNQAELADEMELLLQQDRVCAQKGQLAGRFVADNKGATKRILDYIREKQLI
jgi:3-deoxy-D-manno-octulosonic-acid transferase